MSVKTVPIGHLTQALPPSLGDQKDISSYISLLETTLDIVSKTIADATNYDALYHGTVKAAIDGSGMLGDMRVTEKKIRHYHHDKTQSADPLILDARQVKVSFDAFLLEQSRQRNKDCTLIYGPLKQGARITQKAQNDYKGDFAQVIDIVRATLLFEKPEDLLVSFNEIVRATIRDSQRVVADSFVLVRVKNTLGSTEPIPGGYRDVKINLRHVGTGHVCELQLQLRGYYLLKEAPALDKLKFTTFSLPLNEDGVFMVVLKAGGQELCARLSDDEEQKKKSSHDRYEWARKQLFGTEIRFRDAIFCDASFVTLQTNVTALNNLLERVKEGNSWYIKRLVGAFLLSALGSIGSSDHHFKMIQAELLDVASKIFLVAAESTSHDDAGDFLAMIQDGSLQQWQIRIKTEYWWTLMRMGAYQKAKEGFEKLREDCARSELKDHPVALQVALFYFECMIRSENLDGRQIAELKLEVQRIVKRFGCKKSDGYFEDENHPRQLYAKFVQALLYYTDYVRFGKKKTGGWFDSIKRTLFFQADVLDRVSTVEELPLINNGQSTEQQKWHSGVTPERSDNDNDDKISNIERAQILLEECLLSQFRILSPAHCDIRDSLELLKKIYIAQNKFDKLMDFSSQVLAIVSGKLPIHKKDRGSRYKTLWYEIYTRQLLCQIFLEPQHHAFHILVMTSKTIQSLTSQAYWNNRTISKTKSLTIDSMKQQIQKYKFSPQHEERMVAQNLDLFFKAVKASSFPGFWLTGTGYAYYAIMAQLYKTDKGGLLKKKIPESEGSSINCRLLQRVLYCGGAAMMFLGAGIFLFALSPQWNRLSSDPTFVNASMFLFFFVAGVAHSYVGFFLYFRISHIVRHEDLLIQRVTTLPSLKVLMEG